MFVWAQAERDMLGERWAFHHTPLAEAPFQRNLASLAAAASNRHDYMFRIPCRAARARFAPWRTGHQPTEHARTGGHGVGSDCANLEHIHNLEQSHLQALFGRISS